MIKLNKILLFSPLVFTALQQSMTSACYVSGTHSIAFVTVPSMDIAKKIAHGLVESQLAACVNIIPGVTSVYMWKGEINEDAELILKIKTRTTLIDQLTAFVKKNHPYDICEVISTRIDKGNPEYLKWINDVLPGHTCQDEL